MRTRLHAENDHAAGSSIKLSLSLISLLLLYASLYAALHFQGSKYDSSDHRRFKRDGNYHDQRVTCFTAV